MKTKLLESMEEATCTNCKTSTIYQTRLAGIRMCKKCRDKFDGRKR